MSFVSELFELLNSFYYSLGVQRWNIAMYASIRQNEGVLGHPRTHCLFQPQQQKLMLRLGKLEPTYSEKVKTGGSVDLRPHLH